MEEVTKSTICDGIKCQLCHGRRRRRRITPATATASVVASLAPVAKTPNRTRREDEEEESKLPSKRIVLKVSTSGTWNHPHPPCITSLLSLCILLSLLSSLISGSSHALPANLKIGALFSPEEVEQETIFKFAVDKINADSSLLPQSKLLPQIERIHPNDSFHADKTGEFFFCLNFVTFIYLLFPTLILFVF